MSRYLDENEAWMTVLDRLLWQPEDPGAIGRRGDPLTDSIAMDLQTLMNSRRPEEGIPEEYPEVAASILNYGMPSLGSYGNIGTAAEQNRLCRSIEDAVRTFEPRLRQVQVRIAPSDTGSKSWVRFRLEATVADFEHREIFELRLKPETGEMLVASGQE